MTPTLFEFFEIVAEELSSEPTRVITRESFRINDEEPLLLEELKKAMKAADSTQAIHMAAEALQEHFEARGAKLPFTYDAPTGRFTAVDLEYLKFVKDMSSIRSLGGKSRVFECSVASRLRKRATGSVHRVGHPRDNKKTKIAFNKHLEQLGFEKPVLLGHDKDGGFDILWSLPLGALPHRPLVSVQCKNGDFDMGEADKSIAAGGRSLSQHGGLQHQVHVLCVLFNDYIWRERLTRKHLGFVPLGLTDLAAPTQASADLVLI